MRLLCLLCSAAIAAEPARPQEVFSEAEARWSEGDMEGVIEVFERASEQDPQPEYLFGRARAEIRLERCDAAIEHLQAFLDTAPPDAQREAARVELEKCGADPDAAPEPPPPEPPPPTVRRPETPPPVEAPPPDRTDTLGWGLVGGGGALLLVGATLFAVGAARVASPGATVDEQAYRDRTTLGQRIAWSGVGIGGLGAAVLVGGIVRLVVTSRGSRGSRGATARLR